MARPGFENHPKFRRLVHLLKEPVPHVLGYLECLWRVAYERGEPYIGDAMDVELAAQFPGEHGKLTRALASCRLIDVADRTTADSDRRAADTAPQDASQPSQTPPALAAVEYQVHDLFDHAPDYVRKRHAREAARKSNNRNARDRTTADNGGQRRKTAQNGRTPAPAPAPAPTITPKAPATVPASQIVDADQPGDDGDDVDFRGDFTRGWADAKAKLSAMGVTRWREAIEDAKGNGCTPGHVMELLAHAKANGYPAGSIVYRVTRARMTLPVADGWPPKPPEAPAAVSGRTQAREAADEAANAKKVSDSKVAAAEREKKYGPELEAMEPAEVAEICKANSAMAKLFRKGEKSSLLRDWLLSQLEKRAEVTP